MASHHQTPARAELVRCDTALLECVRSVWVPNSAAWALGLGVGVAASRAAECVATQLALAVGGAIAALELARLAENAALDVPEETRADMRAAVSALRLVGVIASCAGLAAARLVACALLEFDRLKEERRCA